MQKREKKTSKHLECDIETRQKVIKYLKKILKTLLLKNKS